MFLISLNRGGGGSHIDMVYVPAFWGTFFREIWYSDRGEGGFIREEWAEIT